MKKKWSIIFSLLTIVIVYIVCLYAANFMLMLGLLPALVLWGGGEMDIFLAVLPYAGLIAPVVMMIFGAWLSVNKIGKKIFPIWLKWIIVIFFILSSQFPRQYLRWQDTKRLEESAKDAERHDGENIRYYKGTNQPMLNERYLNGKPHGKHEYFYENGQLETEEYYVDGKVDGTVTDYYENGKVSCVSTYDMGIPVGAHRCWFRNGQLSKIESYNSGGKLNGERIYYYDDGKIKSYCKFTNGKPSGACISYYSNSHIEVEDIYDEEGNLIKQQPFVYNPDGTTRPR